MGKGKRDTMQGTRGAVATSGSVLPAEYAGWLAGLKDRISSAQQRAALAVNQELVRRYHQIGREILERQTRLGWGAKVIDRLAADLREAFPDMKGFSSRNLKYMKLFAQMCPDLQIGQQPAAQLPWFHLVTLLTKISDVAEREWYAAQTLQQGWSRPTLDLPGESQVQGWVSFKPRGRGAQRGEGTRNYVRGPRPLEGLSGANGLENPTS